MLYCCCDERILGLIKYSTLFYSIPHKKNPALGNHLAAKFQPDFAKIFCVSNVERIFFLSILFFVALIMGTN